jgi:tRNA A37 threonylcarbamoyltransferase TsaD
MFARNSKALKLKYLQSVWLVGGFAANHWLFSQLQERLAPYNVTLNRPDSQTCVHSLAFFAGRHVKRRVVARRQFAMEL